MLTDQEILEQWAEALVPELKATAGKSFGKTIGYEVKPDELTVYGSPFISVLVDGRGPTKPRARRGSPTLQQSILAWIQAKGIQPGQDKNGRRITVEGLSWAISKSIHLRGTLLYRRGGGNNIFDRVITPQRISSLEAMLSDNYANRVQSQVLREFKKLEQ